MGVTGGTQFESFRSFARRQKTSATSVIRAIKSGRLDKSLARDAVGKPVGIADVALADREWAENQNLAKTPHKFKTRDGEIPAPSTPAPTRSTTVTAPVTPPVTAAATEPSEEDSDAVPKNLNDALIIEKNWSAKLKELDFRKKSGELIEVKDVEARMADDYGACRIKMLAIASKAKTQLGLSHQQAIGLERMIREACESLSNEPVEHQGAA